MDDFNIDLEEIRWGGVDWIGLDQDRDKWRALANAVMNPSVSTKCWVTIEWLFNLWPLE
jgi:hypothetical protein